MGENSLQLFFFRMRLSRCWIQVFFYSQKPSRLLHYHHHRWQIAGKKRTRPALAMLFLQLLGEIRHQVSRKLQEREGDTEEGPQQRTVPDILVSIICLDEYSLGVTKDSYPQYRASLPNSPKDLRLSSLAFPSNSIYKFVYLKLPFCWVSLIMLEQAIKNALWKMLDAFS